MSKRPSDREEPPAKKRGSSRQLTKDDASDEEEEERGSIPTATDDVMKGRRVVKARRAGTGAPPPTPVAASASSNPFAGVSLAMAATDAGKSLQALQNPQQAAAAAPSGDAAERADGNAAAPQPHAAAADGARTSFASFASTAAPFAATAGSGLTFNFGNVAAAAEKGGEEATLGTNGDAEATKRPFSFPSAGADFSFKPPGGGFPAVQSIFGSGSTSAREANGTEAAEESDTAALPSLPPAAETVTGEEDEQTLWSGDGTLYEFDGNGQWRERGRGELRINRGPRRPARLVMRHRGMLRLLMNANLWADMKVTAMDGGKGATFPVVNAAATSADGTPAKLQTFAFRLKQAQQLDEFVASMNRHKQPAEGGIETTA